MEKNVGFADSFIRLSVAAILSLMLIDGAFHGIWVSVVILVILIFAVTALISWCPIWATFGIGTRKS